MLRDLPDAGVFSRASISASWERKGMHDGKEALLARMIRRCFIPLSSELAERLDALPSHQLDDVDAALLDFASVAHLETCLSRNHQ